MKPGHGHPRNIPAILLLLIAGGTCAADAQVPASPHFTITRLADGVYAAIASDTGFAISNAGIVDLGDEVLIFDTFISPRAAADLRRTAAVLTGGKKIRYVVNSHSHNDHIRGNQEFPGATIVSTGKTRKAIAENEPEEIAWEKAHIEERIASARKTLGEERDFARRAEDRFWLGYYIAINDSHDSLRTVLPDLTFEGKLVLHGSRRNVELIDMGSGHAESDLIACLPSDSITFAGDLLFVHRHPYLPDGSPPGWLGALSQIKHLGVRTIVPGHGPVGSIAQVDTMGLYINTVLSLGVQLATRNASDDEAGKEEIPAFCRDWWYARFFPANVRCAMHLARDRKVK